MDEVAMGGRTSPKDYRDVPISAVAGAGPLPSKYFVDISKLPVWHQRKLGACVGHAAAKYKQRLDLKDIKKLPKLSARFLYAMAKCKDGFSGEGTYPRLVAKILKDYGCATEETVPNDTKLSHAEYTYGADESKIPKKAFIEAKQFKISGFAFPNVKKPEDLKNGIIAGDGCILLVRVGKEWYTKKTGESSWDKKDILPIRAPKKIISGHEIYLHGYEDVGDRVKFYFMNSWSDEWADEGNGWFWFDEYVKYMDEAITFVDIPNDILDQVDELPPAEEFKFKFSKDLKLKDKGEDVKALQTALMIEGRFPADLYADLLKHGELGYYGEVTRKAVYDYQVVMQIAPLSELVALQGKTVGPKTRAALNKRFA